MLLAEPKIRFGHTAVINKHHMYIFGGWDGQMTLSDLSVFDLNLKIWMRPAQLKGEIEGRYRHTACATQHAMYVFGGINLALKRFNDIHEFVFESQTWTRCISLDVSPTSRTFHQAVILNDQWLFVFGGFDGMKRNDLYRTRVVPSEGLGLPSSALANDNGGPLRADQSSLVEPQVALADGQALVPRVGGA